MINSFVFLIFSSQAFPTLGFRHFLSTYTAFPNTARNFILAPSELQPLYAYKGKSAYDDNSLDTIKMLKEHYDADVSTFIVKLKSAAGTNHINKDFSSMLLPLLEELVEKVDASEASTLLWCLPKMGFKQYYRPHRNLFNGLVHRLCSSDLKKITPRAVTTALGGMSKFQVRWEDLSPEIQKDIVRALGAICQQLNEREIGNILHSLSKLEIPWHTLPSPVQKGLFNSLLGHESVGPQEAAMSIYALGLMGVSLTELPSESKDRIFEVALSSLETTGTQAAHISVTQQVSNVIYGLAKLNASMKAEPYLPDAICYGIMDAVYRWITVMNEQEVANTVYSLGLMGFQWTDFEPDVCVRIEKALCTRMSSMIMQGVSTSVYGLMLMKVNWAEMSPQFILALEQGLLAGLVLVDKQLAAGRGGGGRLLGSPQSVSNIVYSIGTAGAKWEDLSRGMKTGILHGFLRDGCLMKAQEVSNFIYGLGLMRANFHELPSALQDSFAVELDRVVPLINQLELCQVLNGFAKMEANWDVIPAPLQTALVNAIIRHADMRDLCTACCIYALGCMSATWTQLPRNMVQLLVDRTKVVPMRDQTLSNILIGLHAMKATWKGLEPDLRDAIVESLKDENVFDENISQHVGNTFWALGKMDAEWGSIPVTVLTQAFISCDNIKAQETTNVVYGLAIMDASWSQLDRNFRETLQKVLISTDINTQELANAMYSLAILTFDYVPQSPADEAALIGLYRWVLKVYFKVTDGVGVAESEYQYQYSIFLELILATRPELIAETRPNWKQPVAGTPGDTSPSGMHMRVVEAMTQVLKETSAQYKIVNEYCGLDSGVFPIDVTVYKGKKIVAFVEIDGDFHYTAVTQQLRRKDKLKDFLYSKKYANIPLFRIRQDQCAVLGVERARRELAKWIVSVKSK